MISALFREYKKGTLTWNGLVIANVISLLVLWHKLFLSLLEKVATKHNMAATRLTGQSVLASGFIEGSLVFATNEIHPHCKASPF